MPCYVLEKPALAINSQSQPPRALRPERRGRAASLLIDGIEQLASVNMNNGFPGEMSDVPTAPRHRHRTAIASCRALSDHSNASHP